MVQMEETLSPSQRGWCPASQCRCISNMVYQSDVWRSVRTHLSVGQAGGVDLVSGTIETSLKFDDCNVIRRGVVVVVVVWVHDELLYVQYLLIAVYTIQSMTSTRNFPFWDTKMFQRYSKIAIIKKLTYSQYVGSKQWAAVTIMTGSQLIMDAPQIGILSLVSIMHCQGNWFSSASWLTPTILVLATPQPIVWIYLN